MYSEAATNENHIFVLVNVFFMHHNTHHDRNNESTDDSLQEIAWVFFLNSKSKEPITRICMGRA